MFLDSNRLFSCPLSSLKFHKEIADFTSASKGTKVVDLLNDLSNEIIASPTNIHLVGNEDSLKTCSSLGWNGLSNGKTSNGFLKVSFLF